MIETALLVLGFGILCMAVVNIQRILSLCWMTLDLQEQVSCKLFNPE